MSKSRKPIDYNTIPIELKFHTFTFLNDLDLFSTSLASTKDNELANYVWQKRLKKDFFTESPDTMPSWLYYKILQKEKSRFISYIEKNPIAQFFDDGGMFRNDEFGKTMSETMDKLYKLTPVAQFEKILNLMLEKPISEKYLDQIMDLLFQADTVSNPWLLGLSEEIGNLFAEFIRYSKNSFYFNVEVANAEENDLLSALKQKDINDFEKAILLLTAYKNLKVNIGQHIFSILCKCDAPNILGLILDKNIQHQSGFFPLLMNTAIAAHNEKIIDMLFERGASVNEPIIFKAHQDQHELLIIYYTPLAAAIQLFSDSDSQSACKIIQKLLDQNPDTDQICLIMMGKNPPKVLDLPIFCEQFSNDENISPEKKIEIQGIVDMLIDRHCNRSVSMHTKRM